MYRRYQVGSSFILMADAKLLLKINPVAHWFLTMNRDTIDRMDGNGSCLTPYHPAGCGAGVFRTESGGVTRISLEPT
jgi:hypothetical protein